MRSEERLTPLRPKNPFLHRAESVLPKVRLELAGRMVEIALPAESVATLEWS